MFFITTLQTLEYDSEYNCWDFGAQRTPGYYANLEDARETVVNNWGDIYETIYKYILIEEIESDGLYPECTLKELYQVKRGEKYRDTTYERIDLPENFPQYFSIVIG